MGYLLATFPGKGRARCPSVVCRSPGGDLRLVTFLLLQPCGSLHPAFPPYGRAAEAAQGLVALQKFVLPAAFPALFGKVLTPHSSEILFRLLGTQWTLCLSPALRRFD